LLTATLNGKTIYVSDFDDAYLKQASEQKQLYCPDCQEVIIFKSCNGRQNHFAHHNSDCSYPLSEPESLEHQTGKEAIFQWLRQQFGYEDSFIERKVEQTNQRSDTFVLSINTAVEFQCSPIQAKTWDVRHSLYESASIIDIWILGYSMHKYVNGHLYHHKLNQLEERMYETYGKIVYYDVLTHQFVFLIVDQQTPKYTIGTEYVYKANEVMIKNHQLHTKYDFFTSMQQSRKQKLCKERQKAKETDSFIKEIKEKNEDETKVLATSKQIKFIKHLLLKNKRKIPYKLHGITKSEASILINELSK